MRKKILFPLLLLLTANIANAQFYKSILPSPEFTNALEKIVVDFRLNFRTIQGDSLTKEGDFEVFESTIKLPGAKECIIQKYNSAFDTTASWQAVMYTGDDYKEAVRAYENTFRLVKKSKIRWIDRSLVGFAGEMDSPKEDLRFTMSTLTFELEDRRYNNFYAEVELTGSYDEWQVHLYLHTKKPDYQRMPGL